MKWSHDDDVVVSCPMLRLANESWGLHNSVVSISQSGRSSWIKLCELAKTRSWLKWKLTTRPLDKSMCIICQVELMCYSNFLALRCTEHISQELFLMHLKKFCDGLLGNAQTQVQPVFSLYGCHVRLHASNAKTTNFNTLFLLRVPENATGRGAKAPDYDFTSVDRVNQTGRRYEDTKLVEPMAWPAYLKWYTEKAPSYQSC